jgi:hypothetical protein
MNNALIKKELEDLKSWAQQLTERISKLQEIASQDREIDEKIKEALQRRRSKMFKKQKA